MAVTFMETALDPVEERTSFLVAAVQVSKVNLHSFS